jgi:hypothetical protein
MELLAGRWFAWAHLISPAQHAMNIAFRHLPIMNSFVSAPQVHVAAAKDPKLIGAPFLHLPANAVPTKSAQPATAGGRTITFGSESVQRSILPLSNALVCDEGAGRWFRNPLNSKGAWVVSCERWAHRQTQEDDCELLLPHPRIQKEFLMSAVPLIAAQKRTFREVAFLPIPGAILIFESQYSSK